MGNVEETDGDQVDKVTETREQILAGIRERESKATSGDWFVQHELNVMAPDSRGGYMSPFSNSSLPYEQRMANIAFAAHARADIPYLLSALDSESERVLLEAAKAVCETCRMGLHELVQQHGLWFHPLNHSVHSVRCDAAAIHDLRSKGEM